jgi:MFS family permease
VRVLWLLWLACLPASFVNTIFTQTVAFASDEFGVSAVGQGLGAAVVRWGIVLMLPLAVLADRIGRRRLIVAMAWCAPVAAATGAFAPTFGVLVATQTVARPLGIALSVFVIVAATEEMGSDARAWALGVLALGSGLGAGSAVAALPLAGISPQSWRWTYLVGLVWLVVAAVLTRLLPETHRFALLQSEPGMATSSINRRRLAVQLVAAALVNIFIAATSVFQVRYLTDVRGFSAARAALFTIVTAAPASAALVIGGRLADRRGRRVVASLSTAAGAALLASAFAVGGWPMWALAVAGGIALGFAYPAMAVFRGELFPTARRNVAAAMITVASLVGGSAGLVVAGSAIDAGSGYGTVMWWLALGPIAVSALVLAAFPETAMRELEELNAPEGARPTPR